MGGHTYTVGTVWEDIPTLWALCGRTYLHCGHCVWEDLPTYTVGAVWEGIPTLWALYGMTYLHCGHCMGGHTFCVWDDIPTLWAHTCTVGTPGCVGAVRGAPGHTHCTDCGYTAAGAVCGRPDHNIHNTQDIQSHHQEMTPFIKILENKQLK